MNVPRWSLASIYPSFDSAPYRADAALLAEKSATLLKMLERPVHEAGIRALINVWDDARRAEGDLTAYAGAVYSADTGDGRALAEINALEEALLPLRRAEALLKSRFDEDRAFVLNECERDEGLKPWRFFLFNLLEEARFQMPPELEDLAADLDRSGGAAWERLHDAVSSAAQVVWDEASGEQKTLTVLRELAHDRDRAVRERAWRAEIQGWRSVEIPLAAALNGVKGVSITLDSRRLWYGDAPGGYSQGALKKSAFQSRFGEKTLYSLIAALESSLPMFRRYLKIKARFLGLETCAFYDIFAPVGGNSAKTWTWEESAAFICARFDSFDTRMGDFARRAFAENWIDAESREGKVGGAYCTSFLRAGESRILCNFAGSFDSVTTVAHELGHGYHHEVIKDLPPSRGTYPMTLAETASIFAETIVFEGAEAAQNDPAEKLSLIEGNLQDSCQVIVDILSRFYFEKALFERRGKGEAPPAELCEMMKQAQIAAYGNALDVERLHPYMWAVKSHYYNSGLSFYNYPYAFGLLFSLGLYAGYQKESGGFAEKYRDLLRLTGSANAGQTARSAGFDIEEASFWQGGLSIISHRIDEFEKIAETLNHQ